MKLSRVLLISAAVASFSLHECVAYQAGDDSLSNRTTRFIEDDDDRPGEPGKGKGSFDDTAGDSDTGDDVTTAATAGPTLGQAHHAVREKMLGQIDDLLILNSEELMKAHLADAGNSSGSKTEPITNDIVDQILDKAWARLVLNSVARLAPSFKGDLSKTLTSVIGALGIKLPENSNGIDEAEAEVILARLKESLEKSKLEDLTKQIVEEEHRRLGGRLEPVPAPDE